MNIEEMCRHYTEARAARLEADKVAAALQKEENTIKAQIFEALEDQGRDGCITNGYVYSVVETQKPSPADWGAIYTFIVENNAFELLQKRLSDSAVKERWDSGENVPGVVEVTLRNLSVVKFK